MFPRLGLAAALAAAALSLSACGSPVAVPASTMLSASSVKELGATVVDGSLNTLYRFDRDSASPPSATCVDACAQSWPPLLTEPGRIPFLQGIQESVVGTVLRPDGSTQITIGGWPVYRHASDTGPGSTDGDGADGVWYVVAPDGSKAAQR